MNIPCQHGIGLSILLSAYDLVLQVISGLLYSVMKGTLEARSLKMHPITRACAYKTAYRHMFSFFLSIETFSKFRDDYTDIISWILDTLADLRNVERKQETTCTECVRVPSFYVQ